MLGAPSAEGGGGRSAGAPQVQAHARLPPYEHRVPTLLRELVTV